MARVGCKGVFATFLGFALSSGLEANLAVAEGPSGKDLSATRIGAFETAAALLEEKARQGNSESQYQLASIYRAGRGVRPDPDRAFAWMKKAADGGNAKAQYGLAAMYFGGHGTEVDMEQAQLWARRAEASGYADAASLVEKISKLDKSAQPRVLARALADADLR
jgi:TPR repeat protein